jgi:hypothetical protein
MRLVNTVFERAHQHQDTTTFLVEPDVEINTIGPPVNTGASFLFWRPRVRSLVSLFTERMRLSFNVQTQLSVIALGSCRTATESLASFIASPATFHRLPSRKPNLALRQHRLKTPKHNRERLPIILDTRLGLLAPIQAIDKMF